MNDPNKNPLFEVVATDADLSEALSDVTEAVVSYVQVALDTPDPAQYLFGEVSALISAMAIVFGRPPKEVIDFLALNAPPVWPEDALEQLVQAGLVEVRGGDDEARPGQADGTTAARDDS
jgi:hypothetical protein